MNYVVNNNVLNLDVLPASASTPTTENTLKLYAVNSAPGGSVPKYGSWTPTVLAETVTPTITNPGVIRYVERYVSDGTIHRSTMLTGTNLSGAPNANGYIIFSLPFGWTLSQSTFTYGWNNSQQIVNFSGAPALKITFLGGSTAVGAVTEALYLT